MSTAPLPSPSASGSRWSTRLHWLLHALAVVGELVLIGLGLAIVRVSRADTEFTLLVWWDLVALAHLGLGALVVRRRALRAPTPSHPTTPRTPPKRWLGVYLRVFPFVISMLGLTAAITVVLGPDEPGGRVGGVSLSGALNVGSAVCMVLAWLLLHVSQGRVYRWQYARDGGGLEFPAVEGEPSDIDFLYFAVTLGATFATSDVTVTSTPMRWRVMVHSIGSFFYNTVVLAIGVRILTGG